jgi:hypothetical protein
MVIIQIIVSPLLHKGHILFSLAMFFHLPFSTGNLWFVLGQIYPYHLKYLSIKYVPYVIMEKLEMNFIIYLNVSSISAIKEKFI